MTQCDNGQKVADKYSDNVTADSLKMWVYKWGDKMGEVPDSAIDHINKFLLISEAKNKYADMVVAYKARQHYYQGQDNFPEAYRSALRRMDVARLSNDSLQIRDAIYALGRLLFRNGREYESLDYFLQVEKIDKSPNSRAALFYTLGQVYSVTQTGDDYKELIARYYDLAEKETQKPDFTNVSIKFYITFGRANLLIPYTSSDLYEFHPLSQPRIDSLNTAISLLKEIDYPTALALCYAQLGQFAQAHQYEQQAVEASAGRPEDMRQADYVRAIVRYREKNFNEAIKYASSNVEAYLTLDDWSNAYMNMNILYYAYKTTGNTEKALYFLEQMRELDDKRIKKEKQDQVIISQIKYDSQVKDEEIREANRRNKEIYFRSIVFGTVGVIFIILSIILFRLYSQKRKAYRELVLKLQEWAHVPVKIEKSDPIMADTDSSQPAEKEKQNLLPDETDFCIIKEIEQLMLEKEAFKDPELSIDSLANKINTKRHYVSIAINRCTNKNFHTFINEYRIKNVIRVLSGTDNPAFSIEGIAYDSGFNDRRNFYRVFKKMTGLTPTEFMKNMVVN
jgi:AraC-like DNA-binding protein